MGRKTFKSRSLVRKAHIKLGVRKLLFLKRSAQLKRARRFILGDSEEALRVSQAVGQALLIPVEAYNQVHSLKDFFFPSEERTTRLT